MRNNPFARTGGIRPGRSVFNLSYSKLFDCEHGQLIPVMCDEMVPGDTFVIHNEIVVRLLPMFAPALHEINVFAHYFFVPYRILWDDWETFITGDTDGADTTTMVTWSPSDTTKHSLWDYLGFPIGVTPTGALPIDFPRRAYATIYNEYYRDQNLITEVSLTNEDILQRAWGRDYFTASLPWQQRGTAPALPISGTIDIDGQDANIVVDNVTDSTDFVIRTQSTNNVYLSGSPSGSDSMRWVDPQLEVDLSGATTFDIADLRLSVQIQKWMERNARAGVRYFEFLQSHFGQGGGIGMDSRLDRPEYVGGSRSPIIISEVLQTSASDISGSTTEQGNLAGHGITSDTNFCGSYTSPEFGLMMGILSIMPKTQYSQGINKQWLRSTRYDFFFPEFAHLSEQAIIRAELYADGTTENNNTIFGYIGRYDEMRIKMNMAVGSMAYNQSENHWTLAREFASAPSLNQTFIECDGSTASQNRIFALGTAQPNYIVHYANKIKAIRPIPIESNPGFLDHF
jgi:hypothetical protein